MPGVNRFPLDRTDRAILRELQADGRITNVELSSRVGLTAPPCLRRVRALEEAGVIRGYHAAIDRMAVGWAVLVFAMVSLRSQADPDLRAFEAHARALPQVRECHMLNGEVDFLLKVTAPDLPSFQDFLVRNLLSAPNVAGVRTAMTIRTAKDEPGAPIDP
jgi:DNA-binding Lrp family transcriptional regulator